MLAGYIDHVSDGLQIPLLKALNAARPGRPPSTWGYGGSASFI
jgi:hypothetical protein